MEFELKFWNLVALAAIVLLGWFVKRLVDSLDKRLDIQDEKLDKIILRQESQDRKLLIHDIIIKKNFPEFIVHYPNNE